MKANSRLVLSAAALLLASHLNVWAEQDPTPPAPPIATTETEASSPAPESPASSTSSTSSVDAPISVPATEPEALVPTPEPAPAPSPVETERAESTEPAPQPTEVAEPASVASEDSPELASSQIFSREEKVAAHKRALPDLGIEFTGSLSALGGKQTSALQGEIPARAFSVQFDYQPVFFQKAGIGVLGLGPSIGLYPLYKDPFKPEPRASASILSFWQVGGQVRYQARFFREQPIVPMAGFAVERLTYKFLGQAESANLVLKGPVFGVWLLLNMFEPISAANAYIESGLARSYLVAEMRSLSGSDGTINVSGSSWFFGFRVEL